MNLCWNSRKIKAFGSFPANRQLCFKNKMSAIGGRMSLSVKSVKLLC